jgi:hypothetical protein
MTQKICRKILLLVVKAAGILEDLPEIARPKQTHTNPLNMGSTSVLVVLPKGFL